VSRTSIMVTGSFRASFAFNCSGRHEIAAAQLFARRVLRRCFRGGCDRTPSLNLTEAEKHHNKPSLAVHFLISSLGFTNQVAPQFHFSAATRFGCSRSIFFFAIIPG
jgi:hypothetical protein